MGTTSDETTRALSPMASRAAEKLLHHATRHWNALDAADFGRIYWEGVGAIQVLLDLLAPEIGLDPEQGVELCVLDMLDMPEFTELRESRPGQRYLSRPARSGEDGTAVTWGLYDQTGKRVMDFPAQHNTVYHLDDVLSVAYWMNTEGELVATPPGYRQSLYTRLEARPDGLTQWQVRERDAHSAATPTDQVVSRHRRYQAALESKRDQVAEFRRTNPGGYGYRWVITDQDGREVTAPGDPQ